jgi:hypothetical protein
MGFLADAQCWFIGDDWVTKNGYFLPSNDKGGNVVN